MALAVLDGNQSATTLSSVVTGGEHIVAHTVVSLGSTAIANITSAVSGAVVTIPSLARVANSAATEGVVDGTLNFIKIGGHQDGSNQTAHIVHVSAGGAMKVDASDSSVTFGAVRGTVTISNFPATQTIAGTVTANVAGDWGVVVTSGSVGGTSNSGVIDLTGYPTQSIIEATLAISGGSAVRKFQQIDSGGQYPGNDITLTKAFDGTTVVNFDPANSPGGVYVFRNPGGYIRFSYVSVGQGGNTQYYTLRAVREPYYGLDRPISGTVTVGSMPNGALTTRFGTPTTASSVFATSAVTNANRKYLLIQNVTTGSNVITVGIGFTPTTTQGIQLTAGAGITFESSYIPTGQIYILSSVTASNFTILEA